MIRRHGPPLNAAFSQWSPSQIDRPPWIKLQSDLVYLDYFISSNNVGLARYLDNRNRKHIERNSFQSKC